MGLALTEVMESRVVRTVKETNEAEKDIFQSAVEFNKDCCLAVGNNYEQRWGTLLSYVKVGFGLDRVEELFPIPFYECSQNTHWEKLILSFT